MEYDFSDLKEFCYNKGATDDTPISVLKKWYLEFYESKNKLNIMDNKHELTEQLKVIETEIYNAKFDLRCINSKLETAYQYEEDLRNRMEFARKQTENLRNDFFRKSTEISQKYDKVKNIVDVFTGNFYKHN